MSYRGPAPMPLMNPATPLLTGIPNSLSNGKMIFIAGKPRAGTGFTINLQDGTAQGCDIGLHFDVRFKVESNEKTIVRNSFLKGKWGPEETTVPYLPFASETPFEMLILCENNEFKIAVNDQHFIEFKHRLMPFTRINTLHIGGDVSISQVRFQ